MNVMYETLQSFQRMGSSKTSRVPLSAVIRVCMELAPTTKESLLDLLIDSNACLVDYDAFLRYIFEGSFEKTCRHMDKTPCTTPETVTVPVTKIQRICQDLGKGKLQGEQASIALKIAAGVDLGKRTMDAHVAFASVKGMDADIVKNLQAGTIRLLSVKWLLDQPDDWRMLKYQELEQLEAVGEKPFLLPEDAAKTFDLASRKVGVLSYGWLSEGNPDPQGHRLSVLRRFLQSGQVDLAGLFWDFACLPQKPRTDKESVRFEAALAIMGDMYASFFGSCVLQIRAVPIKPDDFADYNDIPYDHRGWCIFENAVSMQWLVILSYESHKLRAMVEQTVLTPKMLDISNPDFALIPDLCAHAGGMRSTLDSVVTAIQTAKFTGKGDCAVVVELYRNYLRRLCTAMHKIRKAAGVPKEGVYEGQWKGNVKEGQGKCTYADGEVYEGQWNGDVKEGHGKCTYATGGVYEGQWKGDVREGQGKRTYAHGDVSYADGEVYEGQWKGDVREGHGKYTYADGRVYEGQWKGGCRV